MNILQLSLDLGIGGTEKTLQIFAKYLKKHNHNVIVAAFNSANDRKDIIEKFGIKLVFLNKDFAALKTLIMTEKIDIVHIHRSADLVLPIIEYLKKNTLVKIVETNVFGKITGSKIESYVDLRIFVSLFCARRFILKTKTGVDSFWRNNRILYNPLDFEEVFLWSQDEILQYRKKLGASNEDYVIGKYGRNNYLKFGDICIEMLPALIKRVPNIKYFIIGLPNNLRQKAKRLKVYSHIIEVKPIVSSRELSKFIASIDVLAHSSLIGESFGCVYAEAMAHRKPIVTNSTIFMDNAQTEIVEDGVNGIIANTPVSFAKAIDNLLKDKGKYFTIADNNYRKTKNCFDVEILVNDLYAFYEELMDNDSQTSYLINKDSLIKYIKDYPRKNKIRFQDTYYVIKYFLMKKIEGLKRKLT